MAFMPDPFTGYRLQRGGPGSFVDHIPGLANSDGHRDDELPTLVESLPYAHLATESVEAFQRDLVDVTRRLLGIRGPRPLTQT
jgi:hypothetical protein